MRARQLTTPSTYYVVVLVFRVGGPCGSRGLRSWVGGGVIEELSFFLEPCLFLLARALAACHAARAR